MSNTFSVIMLQFLGSVIIIAEFFIPSFGILSVMAMGVFGYSLYIVFTEGSPTVGAFVVIVDMMLIPALIYAGIRIIGRSPLSLSNSLSRANGVVSQDLDLNLLLNKNGIIINDCRPSGRAAIENRKYDVVTDGEYLPKGCEIIVREISGNRIIVKQKSIN